MKFLITLTSPLAVRFNGQTKLSNVVEADQITPKNATPGMTWLRIFAVFDSKTELMYTLANPVEVQVKLSNIRGRQEVR